MYISIALAAYNGEKYLSRQLDSILAQSYHDFELVVCDDSSSDSTWDILQQYQKKERRIRCYQNPKNLGFKKNFEKTILLCKGGFIALSDQDDIWSVDHLEALINNISSYSLVCSQSEGIDKQGNIIKNRLFAKKIDMLMKFDKNNVFLSLLLGNFAQGCAVLFTKDLVRKAFPIPEEVKFHDHWLACAAQAIGNGVFYIDKTTVFYRYHDNNVFARMPDKKRKISKKEENNEWVLYLFKRITIFYSTYRERLNTAQKDVCGALFNYYYWSATSSECMKRLMIYIKYYKVLHYHENKIILSAFFLPRIVKQIIFPLSISDKDRIISLKKEWDTIQAG
jgi:glycosyltransferase involved in cell wall biosynthesis